ncbi:MAG: S8 family serine peptidase [Chloroflexia bacterium]|nr:S8 family serine peptidase [Chloroflexia bacterium]
MEETTTSVERGCAQAAVVAALLLWFVLTLIGGTVLVGNVQQDPNLPGDLATLLPAAAALLAALPAAGLAWLLRGRAGWGATLAIAAGLGAVGGYLMIEGTVRAALPGQANTAALLQLLLLVGYVLLLARWLPTLLGQEERSVAQVLDLHRLAPSTLLLALGLAALLTLFWPRTGALGDRLTSLEIVFRSLAQMTPQVLLFWGLLFYLLRAQLSRRWLAGLMTVVLYLAFSLGAALPNADWGALLWPALLLPLAVLLSELRAHEGGLYPLFPLAWAYRALPALFMDPRDMEAMGIPELGHIGSLVFAAVGAFLLGLALWGGRKLLQVLEARSTTAMRLAFAGLFMLVLCSAWAAMYLSVGAPGFYDDGFLIILEERADLSAAADIADEQARRQYVYEALVQTAERSQAELRQELDELGLPYRPYYLINMIRVDGHRWMMGRFADRPGVAQVILNPNVREYPNRQPLSYGSDYSPSSEVQSNLQAIHADQAWELGVLGQGVVVAGQDTGYDWTHPALQAHYRGWDGQEAVHDYNWHDAWDDAAVPFDDDNHGTHTMGTVLGDDGGNNRPGVAPGARWIGCRNMRRGFGNPGSYAECMEYFLAPYPHGGDPFRDGDVSYSPQVINNSWGCPDFEGCQDDTLQPAVMALRAAGIMMVVSAGNDGPACSTAVEPPARYDAVFSVAATDDRGNLTGFSSRGPVGDLLKPDIAAPGSGVRSSVPGGGYGYADGTSMAGPHVVGVVALVWSANPDLVGDIDATEALLCRTAQARPVDNACTVEDIEEANSPEASLLGEGPICACGDATGTPNNLYGCGLIDAGAAVQEALEENTPLNPGPKTPATAAPSAPN